MEHAELLQPLSISIYSEERFRFNPRIIHILKWHNVKFLRIKIQSTGDGWRLWFIPSETRHPYSRKLALWRSGRVLDYRNVVRWLRQNGEKRTRIPFIWDSNTKEGYIEVQKKDGN